MAYVVRGNGNPLANEELYDKKDEYICVIILDEVEDAALGHIFSKYGRLMPELDSLSEQMINGS